MSPRNTKDNEKIQAASREKIKMAAFELFAQKGYQTTSIGTVAKKAGVSKGLIYHYFESKQDILKAIIKGLMENLPQLMVDGEQIAPEEYIERMIGYSFHFILHHSKINRFLIALAVQPKVIEGLKEELDKAKQQWMNKLEEKFRQLNYESPLVEAHLLGAIFDGVSIGYQTFGKEYPISEIKDIVIEKYKH